VISVVGLRSKPVGPRNASITGGEDRDQKLLRGKLELQQHTRYMAKKPRKQELIAQQHPPDSVNLRMQCTYWA